MRIVFIGSVEFSRQALKKLILLNADIAGVLTMQKSEFNSDFCDLSGECKKEGIPYKYAEDINTAKNIIWIKECQPDIIFCFGFSQILKEGILSIPAKGVVGYHPAALPYNRGRHPLIWALVLGLKKTASSFFYMDKYADHGDIISQRQITISSTDTAATLYKKMVFTALKQIEDFYPELLAGRDKRIPQDDLKANYWRKRGIKDGEIDFRMNSRTIYNLVRALTKPYPGAHLVYKNKQIKIWEAKEIKCRLPNIEYGKVLSVKNKKITVKCYDNAVIFTKHEFKQMPAIGEYLL